MIEAFDRPFVETQIDPKIFPLSIVQLAAYYLVNRLDIRITGDPSQHIDVSLTTRLKHGNKHFRSSKEILWAFNERLVRASLDEHNLEKNADIRHALLRGAFLFESPEIDVLKPKDRTRLKHVTYTYTIEKARAKITLIVQPQDKPLRDTLLALFSVSDRVKEHCCFVVRHYDRGQIFCEISQPQHASVTTLWSQIASALGKTGFLPNQAQRA